MCQGGVLSLRKKLLDTFGAQVSSDHERYPADVKCLGFLYLYVGRYPRNNASRNTRPASQGQETSHSRMMSRFPGRFGAFSSEDVQPNPRSPLDRPSAIFVWIFESSHRSPFIRSGQLVGGVSDVLFSAGIAAQVDASAACAYPDPNPIARETATELFPSLPRRGCVS